MSLGSLELRREPEEVIWERIGFSGVPGVLGGRIGVSRIPW